jgi:hypothetical protein
MKNLVALFGSALCALAIASNTGGAIAAAGDANALAPGKELPDLTVSSNPGIPGYTLLPTCAPGLNAIVFHILVRNIGVAAAAPIANVHAVWVEDIAKPAWAGGAPIPAAIAPKADLLVDVKLGALSPPSTMWGAHTFKVVVNGPKFIAETSYANNQMTIPVVIPKGFCAPSNPVSIASNPSTVITPAPSPKPTHSPFNPGVVMAPGAHLPAPFPPPINLVQVFKKEDCAAHGGSAGSLACYIGLPAGKVALVWDYPFSNPVDGYNVYRNDTAPSGPMSVHMLAPMKPIATQSDPSFKFIVIDPPKPGACFSVTAYHASQESNQSVRFCIGPGGTPKTVSISADRLGTMVADFFVWTDKSVQDNMYANKSPYIRDLLYLVVGYGHSPATFRDQAHTQVSSYTNSLYRGYAHFNTSALNGHQIAQAQLSLVGGTGGNGGQLCLAHYGAADHLWNPGDHLASTSQLGNGPYMGPDLHLDVTSLVQSWANSPASNLGITMDGDQALVIYPMVILASSCMTNFPTATLDVTYY